jgi:hemoglobin-like flavoprotein
MNKTDKVEIWIRVGTILKTMTKAGKKMIARTTPTMDEAGKTIAGTILKTMTKAGKKMIARTTPTMDEAGKTIAGTILKTMTKAGKKMIARMTSMTKTKAGTMIVGTILKTRIRALTMDVGRILRTKIRMVLSKMKKTGLMTGVKMTFRILSHNLKISHKMSHNLMVLEILVMMRPLMKMTLTLRMKFGKNPKFLMISLMKNPLDYLTVNLGVETQTKTMNQN